MIIVLMEIGVLTLQIADAIIEGSDKGMGFESIAKSIDGCVETAKIRLRLSVMRDYSATHLDPGQSFD